MPRTCGRFFLCARSGLNTARTAIVAAPIDGDVVLEHGFAVNVPNIYNVHVVDRAVIEEAVALPPPPYPSPGQAVARAGTWVMAPEVGFLWTPLYWAWDNGAYVFYDGYWGCLNSGQMQQRLERFLIVVPDGNSAHFDFLGTEQNSCTFEKSTSR
jgi:hypothetical protein